MAEFGLFNDEATDWSEEEAVEAGFYSREDAVTALKERYTEEDELTVHEIEESEEEIPDECETCGGELDEDGNCLSYECTDCDE
jgi:hypothetical protein